ncbi:MAG: PilZ domain-containing protein [Gammaproteobacteria bacterium]
MGTITLLETITLTIKELSALVSSYMPFLKSGGLFIPTQRKFELGHSLNLNIHLVDLQDKIQAEGKVVWVTPKGAQSNRAAGIGLEFSGANATAVRSKLEGYLATLLKTDYNSHTM